MSNWKTTINIALRQSEKSYFKKSNSFEFQIGPITINGRIELTSITNEEKSNQLYEQFSSISRELSYGTPMVYSDSHQKRIDDRYAKKRKLMMDVQVEQSEMIIPRLGFVIKSVGIAGIRPESPEIMKSLKSMFQNVMDNIIEPYLKKNCKDLQCIWIQDGYFLYLNKYENRGGFPYKRID